MCRIVLLLNCVASLQKGPHVAKIKIEIFVGLNRAGHDKSVEKDSVLTQIFTKLWSIYELHNYIILIIILDIIIYIIYIIIKKTTVYANENLYIILYDLFSRLWYIATCGPFCKDTTQLNFI